MDDVMRKKLADINKHLEMLEKDSLMVKAKRAELVMSLMASIIGDLMYEVGQLKGENKWLVG